MDGQGWGEITLVGYKQCVCIGVAFAYLEKISISMTFLRILHNGRFKFELIYFCCLHPGPCLNIKTVLSTYGDFHVKDKMAVRTSYL